MEASKLRDSAPDMVGQLLLLIRLALLQDRLSVFHPFGWIPFMVPRYGHCLWQCSLPLLGANIALIAILFESAASREQFGPIPHDANLHELGVR